LHFEGWTTLDEYGYDFGTVRRLGDLGKALLRV